MSEDKKTIDYDNFSLDDLEDLPSFKPFPTGGYLIRLEKGLERKKIGTHEGVEANMTILHVLECNSQDLNAGEEVPKAGDKCSTVFMLDNEIGRGKLKEFGAPIAAKFGKSWKELQPGSVGFELVIIGKRTQDKEDKDKYYFNITKVSDAAEV